MHAQHASHGAPPHRHDHGDRQRHRGGDDGHLPHHGGDGDAYGARCWAHRHGHRQHRLQHGQLGEQVRQQGLLPCHQPGQRWFQLCLFTLFLWEQKQSVPRTKITVRSTLILSRHED